MQLSSNLNNGLIQELDRLCGTSVNNYSFKQKISDLNFALDWYFDLAEKASLAWNKDDSNQANPPIDTQNIVSGTNRYKLSAFSQEITELLKLEILTSTGTGQKLFPDTLDSFGNLLGVQSGQVGDAPNSFQEAYLNAPGGTPTNYIKYGDYIYLRPSPNYSLASALKAYFNRPASKFSFLAISSIDTSTETITTTLSHGMSAGDTVIFETDGTIPTGLTADTQYYVISAGLTTTAFRVSTTAGGSAVDITNAQTASNHSVLQTSKSPGINSMHHESLVTKASNRFMTFNNTNGVYNSRLSVTTPQEMKDERMVSTFYSNRGRDIKPRLVSTNVNNR